VKSSPFEYIEQNLKRDVLEPGCIDEDLRSNRGYLCPSISKYILGYFTTNEWIGNDFIVNKSPNYVYTATALTDMVTLCATYSDFANMP